MQQQNLAALSESRFKEQAKASENITPTLEIVNAN